MKEEHPDMKITEISKVLGLRWGKMDDAQKKPHQKRADADKERYVNYLPSPHSSDPYIPTTHV